MLRLEGVDDGVMGKDPVRAIASRATKRWSRLLLRAPRLRYSARCDDTEGCEEEMKNARHSPIRTLVFLCTMLAAAGAFAQAYPSRPIRLVIPLGVGGSSDVIARLISPRMSEILGQQIVVDNR